MINESELSEEVPSTLGARPELIGNTVRSFIN